MEDSAKIKTVILHLEGRALQLHQYFSRTHKGSATFQWDFYLEEMHKRFEDIEFLDPMSNIVALKQLGTMDDYYDDFLSLLNSLQLSPKYAFSIFSNNLKLKISKTVRLFFPKTLSHAFNLAKKIETLNYLSPRRPFVPYKNPSQAPPNSFLSFNQTLSLSPMIANSQYPYASSSTNDK